MNLLYIKQCFATAFIATIVCAACSTSKNAAEASNTEDIGRLLESKSFMFTPQTATPTGSRTRQITGGFFFRLSGDTVQSYLPYFGRSFSAPINPSQGGMDFTTTNFGYQAEQGRKGATRIVIEPRSGTDVRQITMQVFPNGNASLQAISNSRSAISYNGRISAVRR
jgi:hypothetical protein